MNLVVARAVWIYRGRVDRCVPFRAHRRLRTDSPVAVNGHKRPRNPFSLLVVDRTT